MALSRTGWSKSVTGVVLEGDSSELYDEWNMKGYGYTATEQWCCTPVRETALQIASYVKDNPVPAVPSPYFGSWTSLSFF